MLTDTLRVLASSLQAPVIIVLILLVVTMLVIFGMFVAELFTERRRFTASLAKIVDELEMYDDPARVVRTSGLLARQKTALLELLAHPEIDGTARESLAVNLVAEEQSHFDNRVRITDLIAKVSPMLGLMGTLIPLGPGLIAIGEGNTEVLANSLLIAFDTTILGLVVAAVALLVSTVRKAWYAKYMSAFESAAECVLEKANLASEQYRATQGADASTHAAGQTPAPASAAGQAEAQGPTSTQTDATQPFASADPFAPPAQVYYAAPQGEGAR